MTDEDRFPDTQLKHPPETDDLDRERRNQDFTDHRVADAGPTRGTYPDNGHLGVKMSPEGEILATPTAEGDDVSAKGFFSDVQDAPDDPAAPAPGSLLNDDYSASSEGGKRG